MLMEDKKQSRMPLIGISATLMVIESGSFIGHKRAAVGDHYIQAINLAGGVPLILPIVGDQNLVRQQMGVVDGLLLSGGYDVSPLQYGEEPRVGLEAICPVRDAYEIELIRLARLSGKPILGICRGMQLLNVAFGGTLHQDIHSSLPNVLQHNSKADPDEATHSVAIFPGTLLQKIMNETTLLTNSFHHQAIKDLAPNFIVNARTQDGVVEGIESTQDSFILGTQWHPEMMIAKHPKMLELFRSFVKATKEGMGG